MRLLDHLLPAGVAGVGVAVGDARAGVLAGLLVYFLAKIAASLQRTAL